MKNENIIFNINKRDGSKGILESKKHYHNFFEIYYMKSGDCNYFIDNKIYSIKPHDIVIIPSGIIHNTTYTNTSYERILIEFSKDYISPLLIPGLQIYFDNHIYRPSYSEKIEELILKMQEEYKKSDLFSDELIRGYMTEFFSYIIRNKSEYTPDNEEIKKINVIIEEITNYINKNFNNDITLEKISDMAGFSKYHFSKFFKKHTGFGYKEYLLIIRLKEAKRLLIKTNKTVCDIAFLCGFNDSNYFSTVFKEKNGYSPLEYKKMHL